MASISFRNVTKIYEGAKTPVVPNLDLEIADKEFIILVGPSGCGKSTTLRMIAGLETISSGELYIGDRLVNAIPPKDRDIAMVFQNYALYPHMTVYNNIAFGLNLRKMPKDEIDKRVHEAAQILDLEQLLNRKPKQLSGGQRQRVALGRAMVRNPAVFLLDEPLSNLDAKLRTSMRSEITRLHRRLDTTFVYVTHDQTEAMTMGDRICVMKSGIIQQYDTPQVLYDSPDNLFVAGFIGSPQMNFLDAEIKEEGGKLYAVVKTEQTDKLLIPDDKCAALKPYIGKTVTLGIRPEHFADVEQVADDNYLTAKVDFRELLGAEYNLYVELGDTKAIVKIPSTQRMPEGDVVKIPVLLRKMHFFDKETERAICH
ncbi:MAG: sn-glycerol-3-phosphate ABC transporter ATP-binding protein UgpC [Lachnospiraceae bacterium]|nr:sn-glycerol-3-phosphate ABC transporter ATP-binding protein UgpC [Lachnospiraceae bacterium]